MVNVMGCSTDLSELRVFMSCGFKFSLTVCPGSANFLPERLCVAGRWRSISFVYLRESHRVVRPAGHMYAPGVPLSSLKRLVHCG